MYHDPHRLSIWVIGMNQFANLANFRQTFAYQPLNFQLNNLFVNRILTFVAIRRYRLGGDGGVEWLGLGGGGDGLIEAVEGGGLAVFGF